MPYCQEHFNIFNLLIKIISSVSLKKKSSVYFITVKLKQAWSLFQLLCFWRGWRLRGGFDSYMICVRYIVCGNFSHSVQWRIRRIHCVLVKNISEVVFSSDFCYCFFYGDLYFECCFLIGFLEGRSSFVCVKSWDKFIGCIYWFCGMLLVYVVCCRFVWVKYCLEVKWLRFACNHSLSLCISVCWVVLCNLLCLWVCLSVYISWCWMRHFCDVYGNDCDCMMIGWLTIIF